MSIDPRNPEHCPKIVVSSQEKAQEELWTNPKHPCMNEITVDEVVEAILKKLNV